MHKKGIKIIILILLTPVIIIPIITSSCSSIKVSDAAEISLESAKTEGTQETMAKETVKDTESATGTTQLQTTESTAGEIKNGEVIFKTEDDIQLNGNIFGRGDRWVILSHMYPTDQESWFDFAGELSERSYVALTFDFRGYGKSGGSKDDIVNIFKDVTAAITLAKSYNCRQVFLVGASMGGTASIIAASMDSTISGVVALAAPGKMGDDLDAISVVPELKMPKLFICAIGDDYHAKAAKAFYEKSVEPKTLEIMENSSEHGTFIFEKEPENAVRLKTIIINFLDSIK
jgi:alpha/beta superfamily hydrolase